MTVFASVLVMAACSNMSPNQSTNPFPQTHDPSVPTTVSASGHAYYDSAPVVLAQPVAPIKVTAAQIGRDYHNNKVAAERKWAGKYVEFTGTVLNISDSWTPSVSFNLPPELFAQMVCNVSDESELAGPNLMSGKTATVRGTIEGDQMLGVVRMTDCTVL